MKLSDIDYRDLERLLREMKPRTKFFESIKQEMIRRDRWAKLPRGMAFRKGGDIRRFVVKK